MAGGYHEDRWAQGCTLAPGAPPPYLLRRWHAVDDFVYFSHRWGAGAWLLWRSSDPVPELGGRRG